MRPVVLLLLAALSAGAAAFQPRDPSADNDMLPGWKSQSYQEEEGRPWMQVLNEDARIFLFHNFLSPEECDHIIGMAKPRLARSDVVNSGTGSSEVSDIRTSRGTFLERGEDEVVKAIEERIARWTLLPVGNGEGLQVLRYESKQKYDGHYDYFFDKVSVRNGGNRYATVLMYLSDVEEGGETVFPNIPAPGGDNGPEYSNCARHHLAAKPKKGNAVLFHSIKPNGELERRSLHTACPVIKGVKWSAPKWIHVGHFAAGGEKPEYVELRPQKIPGSATDCEDRDELCDEWAAGGECEHNRPFMVGTVAQPGACLRACDACKVLRGAAAEGLHRKMPA